MRISGSLPLVARTAMPSPSANGSETISKLSPYIFICMGAVKPRSLIFAQLSEATRTVLNPFPAADWSSLFFLTSGQYHTPGYGKLIRIDRPQLSQI
jgi:hypothetical protein